MKIKKVKRETFSFHLLINTVLQIVLIRHRSNVDHHTCRTYRDKLC